MEYEEILSRMMERIPDRYDKREGSLFWTILGPVAWAIAQCHYILTWAVGLVYPDTATGEYLDLNCAAFGVERKEATKARREVIATDRDGNSMALEVGERLGLGAVFWVVIESSPTGGIAEAETPGSGANLLTGELLPIGAIEGLGAVSLGGVVLTGADTEVDESYRARFLATTREQPYGGNIADYRQRTLSISGVGACAVFPVWAGDGTVKVVIGDDRGRAATPALVDQVQEMMGKAGEGIAPIGHSVTVDSAVNIPIDITGRVWLKQGVSLEAVRPLVEASIREYLDSIPFDGATVFGAQVMVAALSIEGVLDVQDVTLCGQAGNLALTKTAQLFQTPVLGALTLTEVV